MATNLDMGMKCIKYMLIVVNIMFVITASLIISVGCTIYAIYDDLDHFVHNGFYSPTNLLIAIGFILLCVSIFGFHGAFKESTAMINIFAGLLFLIFILDISAAIAAYCLQNGLVEMVNGRLNYTLDHYETETASKDAMDFVQSRLVCCGISSPGDWAMGENENTTVPPSCCPENNGNNTCDVEQAYQNGCMRKLTYIISQSAFLVGTGALTIAFIKFVGIVFAILLAKSIRQAKTDRERRKWEIREQILINNPYTQMEARPKKLMKNPAPTIYVPNIGHSVS